MWAMRPVNEMNGTEVIFNDGVAYQRFMGRWSRSVGSVFLDWLAPRRHLHWLDVGCGTRAFTELVFDTCFPARLVAVDPAIDQIEYARRRPISQRAEFKAATATELPFADRLFDVITSALVINFISDRPRALAEMRRVARPRGLVALYVWDVAAGLGPSWPIAQAIRSIGISPPQMPGADDCTLKALHTLFEQTGLQSTDVRQIEVESTYSDFDDFWTSQTPAFSPMGRCLAALDESERARLRASVAALLPVEPDGSVTYSARANALKGKVPDLPSA
jgi:ubiquinone/menaquinone biosynthesis C-methylase UbiE